MKRIKLSQNKYALVDDEDYECLSQWKWSLTVKGYAFCQKTGKYMHRLINDTPKGEDTDHINRNKLDNRRVNLRTATRSLNVLNTAMRSDNTTGFRGVSWNNKKKRYFAQMKVGETHLVRSFRDINDAVKVRQDWEREFVCSA